MDSNHSGGLRLAECARLALCLLRLEDTRDGAWPEARTPPPWAGRLKASVWACVALLAGLGLAQLH